MDTIFALASAQGKAGVAVVRISGPRAHDSLSLLTQQDTTNRGMRLCSLYDMQGQHLDDALVLIFFAPASFTGEDVVELHLHGSVAVVTAVLRTLGKNDDLRLAEPGEFTRRAMENGKLDLSQVEGLADLIDAETESQRRQAQEVLSGRLGDLAERWRVDLIRAASLIEAVIDFADEDIPTDVTPEVTALLEKVLAELVAETDVIHIAERIRSGFEVAIVGAPNVGKSTLLNALAGREAAITSEYAGTTRDVIEVRMDLSGLAVTFLDTAGLRETTDAVEKMGISLARSRADRADLRVFLAETALDLDVPFRDGDIVVRPKADLRENRSNSVSGMTGEGVTDLIEQISEVLKYRSANAGVATRERHRIAIERAQISLELAQSLLSAQSEQYELVAEELRRAIRALESLVGRVDVENLLDEIFASFCLGK
ncbi:tRNA uridine-5-carboxymethylaminomethyl(34) synthesis GTPase MnmE [Sedimentitalea todarodis]|uniref:tRNA modification GTPase MnmE n=1 Tax=Sedimentitalea todarodis TaxID=1631240 RepID=A0ABU3VIP8_9RHOB|nr:tRNA uridine-5-carboxymethylaminomethyl(34) synthesis GTPase MnmE [Sedimentitalea todarodis]MDU9006056.1 tRNA uridine-5-carboxymethylaminomethyl(34) synthesis GTPase MnmE [Sedimentitalea todarodis]